jgi:predicted RNA-binding protein with PIN domain
VSVPTDPHPRGAGTGDHDGYATPAPPDHATPATCDGATPGPSGDVTPAPLPTTADLPGPTRRQLAEIAAAALGDLPENEVPPALRRVRAFAPTRRAKAAAGPLLAALDGDGVLRGHAALLWSKAHPDLAAGLPRTAAGDRTPVSADEVREDDCAAPENGSGAGEGRGSPAGTGPDEGADDELWLLGAFLTRPEGWQGLVGVLADRLVDREAHRQARHAEAAARVRADAAVAELGRTRAELAHAQAENAVLTEEIAGLRREQRRLRADADRARAAARAAEQEAARIAQQARARSDEAETALQRAAEQVAQAEDRLVQARRLAREGRSLADVRARLLLDTIVDAAAGLRRELALPPATQRPADLVLPQAADTPGSVPAPPARAQAGDDPALLEQLLALPQSHLVVDGYNVTKTGYGALPLAEQRRRLVDALGVLAVRTASEVTCCFDGAEVDARGASRVRGVRVVFSEPGTTADELIRRLVRAEPPGRPVVVVSSDAEVAANSRSSGAHAVPSTALLRLLGGGRGWAAGAGRPGLDGRAG